MSAAAINVTLVNAASAKAQHVSLPRDMTVAGLQQLAPGSKALAFTVEGCTPSAAATLGDLFDTCAKGGALEVTFDAQHQYGCGLFTLCCTINSVDNSR